MAQQCATTLSLAKELEVPMQNDSTKRCNECGETKPHEDFYLRKTGKKAGMLSYICRACDSEKRRQYRQSDPERARRQRRRYYKANRESVIEKQKRYAEANAEKVDAYQKQYRDEHQEDRKSYMQEYWPEHYAANRHKYIEKRKQRSALIQGHGKGFRKSDIRQMYEQQKGRCYWCEEELNGSYEIDHIIPLSKGGPHHLGNVCCACFSCNRSKHAKMPYEFSDRLF